MILFCTACKANHPFNRSEVERIVYALQAELGDEIDQPRYLENSARPRDRSSPRRPGTRKRLQFPERQSAGAGS